jgi:hypothetical protein
MLRRFAYPLYDAADGAGAGASAPIPELSAQDRLNALTPEARSTWDLTGAWPEPAKVTTTAEDDDDEPEPVVAPTTETPAPAPVQEPAPAEAGKLAAERRTGKVSRQQQINDLIRKSTEADLRARALEAEIQAIKAGKPAAEAKPEPVAEPVVDPNDPEPQETQFEDYRAFVKAQSRWEIRQAKREADADAEKSSRAKSEAEQRDADRARVVSWVERRDAFAATTPAFAAQDVQAFLGTLRTGTPTGDAIADSDVGPQMALYLAQHPDEADRIARLAPASALRALGKLEAKFESDTLTSASASAGPAAKTVTTAPAPPTTLAARSASPADPSAAALARGDYVAWEAEENRKALSASR